MSASSPPPRAPRLLLGPGILLAATSIGGSHLLLASRAGAEHGFALLWVVVLAHALKYFAFEAGPRVALSTGRSLLHAYAAVPPPRWAPRAKGWALWLGLLDMTLEAIGVIAAVLALTAAIAATAFPILGVGTWALLLVALILGLLRTGGYRYLRGISLWMMILLLAGTLAAFAAALPSPVRAASGLVPSLPEGSGIVATALLGWMPTAIGVSVWHSVWCLGDRRFWSQTLTPADRLRLGLRDARIGLLLSLVIGACFVCLGAALLHPTALPEEGLALVERLGDLYTSELGAWMRPVFLVLAFFAMFSTAYASMDGFPVTFLSGLAILRGDELGTFPQRQRLYWIYLVGVSLAGVGVLLALPSPKLLFAALASLTFVLSPLYAFLNLWCVVRFVPAEARPPRWQIAAALLCALALLTGSAIALASALL
ncbi:MAG: divalent metal cation transporter, partial [Planctomycetes bacterium]|nr:divalent metal cation transporter [Planctomycetota bacterium]